MLRIHDDWSNFIKVNDYYGEILLLEDLRYGSFTFHTAIFKNHKFRRSLIIQSNNVGKKCILT